MPQIEARKVAKRKILTNKGEINKSKSILTHLKDLKTKIEKDNFLKKCDNDQLNICGNCGGDISKQRYRHAIVLIEKQRKCSPGSMWLTRGVSVLIATCCYSVVSVAGVTP